MKYPCLFYNAFKKHFYHTKHFWRKIKYLKKFIKHFLKIEKSLITVTLETINKWFFLKCF